METCRFGIIGAGRIAEKFANTFRTEETGKALLQGVASTDERKADKFARQYGIPKSFGSYGALLNDPEIDIVYIATTNNVHFDCCMDAIAAGKHVLCEKPMVILPRQAQQLADAAKAKGVFLMEAMWARFLPAMIQARTWIEEGRIGELRLVSAGLCLNREPAEYARLYQPELGGGALYDLGVYLIEGTQYLIGQTMPKKVVSTCQRAETWVDVTSLVQLLFENGVAAELKCSISFEGCNGVYIYGSKGYIRLLPSLNCPQEACLYTSGSDQPEETFSFPIRSGFEFEIIHVAQCVLEGNDQSPIMPMRDTIACAEIFEKVFTQ